jgi:hypothetical protein
MMTRFCVDYWTKFTLNYLYFTFFIVKQNNFFLFCNIYFEKYYFLTSEYFKLQNVLISYFFVAINRFQFKLYNKSLHFSQKWLMKKIIHFWFHKVEWNFLRSRLSWLIFDYIFFLRIIRIFKIMKYD